MMRRVYSPACSPANFCFGEQSHSLYIITGWRGAGKTTWCSELTHYARLYGLTTGGFITLPHIDNDQKVAFDLHNLLTGERRTLGRRANTFTNQHIGCWQMDANVLAWGNQILRDSVNADVVFIDELGPLEFSKGEGFQSALYLLDNTAFKQAFVVIRPELLDIAQRRWPHATIIDLGGKARDCCA